MANKKMDWEQFLGAGIWVAIILGYGLVIAADVFQMIPASLGRVVLLFAGLILSVHGAWKAQWVNIVFGVFVMLYSLAKILGWL